MLHGRKINKNWDSFYGLLVCKSNPDYKVHTDDCVTPQEALWLILDLDEREWAKGEIMGDFIAALNETVDFEEILTQPYGDHDE